MYEMFLAIVGAIFLSVFIGVPWYFGMKVLLAIWDTFLESITIEEEEEEDDDNV